MLAQPAFNAQQLLTSSIVLKMSFQQREIRRHRRYRTGVRPFPVDELTISMLLLQCNLELSRSFNVYGGFAVASCMAKRIGAASGYRLPTTAAALKRSRSDYRE